MTSAQFSARLCFLFCLALALGLCACSSTVCTPTRYWVPDPVADGDMDTAQDRDSDAVDTGDRDTAEAENEADGELDVDSEAETAPADGDLETDTEAGEGEAEEEVVPQPLALDDFDALEPVLGGALAYDWTDDVPPLARVRYFSAATSSSPSFTQSGAATLLAAPRDASHLTVSDKEGWAIYVPYRAGAVASEPPLILRHQEDKTFTFYGLSLPEALVGKAYRAVFLPQNPQVAQKTFLFAVIALWHNESASDYMTARVFKAVFADGAFKVTADGQTQLIGLLRRVESQTRMKLLERADTFFIAMNDLFYRFNAQGLYAPEQGNFKPAFSGVAAGTAQTVIDAAYSGDGAYLSILMRIEAKVYWGIWRTSNLSQPWLSRTIPNGTDTMRTTFTPKGVFAIASEADFGAQAQLLVLDVSGLYPKPWENALYTYGRPVFLDGPERLLQINPLSVDGGNSYGFTPKEVPLASLYATSGAR